MGAGEEWNSEGQASPAFLLGLSQWGHKHLIVTFTSAHCLAAWHGDTAKHPTMYRTASHNELPGPKYQQRWDFGGNLTVSPGTISSSNSPGECYASRKWADDQISWLNHTEVEDFLFRGWRRIFLHFCYVGHEQGTMQPLAAILWTRGKATLGLKLTLC